MHVRVGYERNLDGLKRVRRFRPKCADAAQSAQIPPRVRRFRPECADSAKTYEKFRQDYVRNMQDYVYMLIRGLFLSHT